MEFLLAVGIGINIFTLFQLLRGKHSHLLPNKIAVCILVVWTVRFVLRYVQGFDFIFEYPALLALSQNLFFLDPVLLWLYAKSLLKQEDFSAKYLLHFIPFAIATTITVGGAFITPKEEFVAEYKANVAALKNYDFPFSPEVIILAFIMIAVLSIYLIKSMREVKAYNQSLLANISNLKNLNAEWIINLLRIWIGLFMLPLLIYLVNYMAPVISVQLLSYVLISAFVLLSFFFNSNILNQEYALASLIQQEEEAKPKVSTSKADASQLERLYEALEESKYYEYEALSLQKLANHLKMKPAELTNLIKLSEYENFYDLINSYRIDAVKLDLRNSDEQIIIIAFNNGFNSKSAFNKIFKEKTGMTPSIYRKTA